MIIRSYKITFYIILSTKAVFIWWFQCMNTSVRTDRSSGFIIEIGFSYSSYIGFEFDFGYGTMFSAADLNLSYVS